MAPHLEQKSFGDQVCSGCIEYIRQELRRFRHDLWIKLPEYFALIDKLLFLFFISFLFLLLLFSLLLIDFLGQIEKKSLSKSHTTECSQSAAATYNLAVPVRMHLSGAEW